MERQLPLAVAFSLLPVMTSFYSNHLTFDRMASSSGLEIDCHRLGEASIGAMGSGFVPSLSHRQILKREDISSLLPDNFGGVNYTGHVCLFKGSENIFSSSPTSCLSDHSLSVWRDSKSRKTMQEGFPTGVY